jgi:hypothetical protein
MPLHWCLLAKSPTPAQSSHLHRPCVCPTTQPQVLQGRRQRARARAARAQALVRRPGLGGARAAQPGRLAQGAAEPAAAAAVAGGAAGAAGAGAGAAGAGAGAGTAGRRRRRSKQRPGRQQRRGGRRDASVLWGAWRCPLQRQQELARVPQVGGHRTRADGFAPAGARQARERRARRRAGAKARGRVRRDVHVEIRRPENVRRCLSGGNGWGSIMASAAMCEPSGLGLGRAAVAGSSTARAQPPPPPHQPRPRHGAG